MVSFFESDRHHTTVGGFAVLVLKLDRGVMNAKLQGQTIFYLPQYRLAG